MSDLARPGDSIRYQVSSSGRPPLLPTRGYGSTSAMFGPNLAGAGTRNQVVTWDIGGHGGSEHPARIKAPTLVIGRADDTPFLDAADCMSAKVGRARKVVIPAAGHAPDMSQSELFNAELCSFLDEVAAEEGAS